MKINILQGIFAGSPIKGGAIEAARLTAKNLSAKDKVCHISRLDEGLQKNEDIVV